MHWYLQYLNLIFPVHSRRAAGNSAGATITSESLAAIARASGIEGEAAESQPGPFRSGEPLRVISSSAANRIRARTDEAARSGQHRCGVRLQSRLPRSDRSAREDGSIGVRLHPK